MSITTTNNQKQIKEKSFYKLVEQLLKAQEMYEKTKHYVYHHEIVATKKSIWEHIHESKEKERYKTQKKLFD